MYELMPNGSLDMHLHCNTGSKLPLSWVARHEIVLGIGAALLYPHQDWEQCVVHRDIKPSNIMLDTSYNAKLGDFGLARLVDHGRGSHTTVLAGTMGYMDPECIVTGKACAESNVYSFGVVLLEIACGQRPVVISRDDDDDGATIHIVQLVWDAYYGQGHLLGAADPDHAMRPSIRQAVGVLRLEAPLPRLPVKMPVATFLSPADQNCLFGSGSVPLLLEADKCSTTTATCTYSTCQDEVKQ